MKKPKKRYRQQREVPILTSTIPDREKVEGEPHMVGYVRVSTLCGHGMTVSRKEWQDWGVQWRQGAWLSPGADTLDLYHASCRSGERWTTVASYVEHTGRSGLHCSPGIPEYAVDFQGVE